jgi:hypothetical protein
VKLLVAILFWIVAAVFVAPAWYFAKMLFNTEPGWVPAPDFL